MGCAGSKDAREPSDGLRGGGQDGWATGSAAVTLTSDRAATANPLLKKPSAAVAMQQPLTSSRAPSLPNAVHPAAKVAAPAADDPVGPSAIMLQDKDVPSFPAYVLADFEAIVAGVELSVRKGEWVSVQVDDADPAPEGWCLCCTSRSGSDEYGLVPWANLVSASHAEAEIKALEVGGALKQASVAAARRLREMTIMLTRGESGTFGLDIDDSNIVRSVAPGGAAERQGLLQQNDVIIAVDGVALTNRSLVEVMRKGKRSYELKLLRGVYASGAEQEEAMGTHRAQTTVSAIEGGAAIKEEKRTVAVRRGETGLGIDVSERNVILRVLPGSLAAADGVLRAGDVIVAVDGEELGKRWLAEVIRPGLHSYSFTTLRESWAGPAGQPRSATVNDDIHSLKSWNIADLRDMVSATVAQEAAAAVPDVQQRSSTDSSKQQFGSVDAPLQHRAPPAAPASLGAMRMEEMLRAAMEAAAGDESRATEFEEALSKYRGHPGVLRKQREAEQGRTSENEPAYHAERASISQEEHANVPEEARALTRFPILRLLLLSSPEEIDGGMPVHETLSFHLDRRMSEQQARAVLFALPRRFTVDQEPRWGGKGLRERWLETQHEIFDEMAADGFPGAAWTEADAAVAREEAAAASAAREETARLEAEAAAAKARADTEEEARLEAEEKARAEAGERAKLEAEQKARQEAEARARAEAEEQARLEAEEQARLDAKERARLDAEARARQQAEQKARQEAEEKARAEAEAKAAAAAAATPTKPRSASSTPRPKAGRSYKETQLLQRIGQGTYGSVYRGVCDGEEVAVKVMALQPDTAADIKREIKIMRECACDHIIAYRDAFVREHEMRSTLWVVMEFCRVGSTLDVMRRASKSGVALEEAQICWVVDGMLRALDYMHVQRTAIHRDIKAANVLLTADAEVKLADLGVAAQLYNTMSKRGTMIGTPHWMAPETFSQEGDGAYDTKVDIWGLGITAIELAQLFPPFHETKSVFKVMMLIVNGDPATLDPATPATPEFHDFLRTALVKDPAERPSAAQLLQHDWIRGARHEPLAALVAAQEQQLLISQNAQAESARESGLL